MRGGTFRTDPMLGVLLILSLFAVVVFLPLLLLAWGVAKLL
jgi:hypothetical protein